MNDSNRIGQLIPPIITNFKWTDKTGKHQEVRFYPFLSKQNLKKYVISSGSKRSGHAMFNYVGLDRTPHFVLYQK